MIEDAGSADAPAVVMVHGWGGSFETTWLSSGLPALLEDAGRQVVGVDLLGHGTAPKPTDPGAYADLGTRIVDALPNDRVDAIGFSLGALTLLRVAAAHPDRFRRLVLAGIGRNVFERDGSGTEAIVAGLDHLADGGDPSELNTTVRLFTQYAHQPGNDPAALRALMSRSAPAIERSDLARLAIPTLVVVGDQDFVHPADELVEALPQARAVTLPRVDHFATTESFGFFDAALEFLGAQ